MEAHRTNLLTEHEIDEVLKEHPEDGWDLIHEHRIKPVTLEVVPEDETMRDSTIENRVGKIAAKGADIQPPLAA